MAGCKTLLVPPSAPAGRLEEVRGLYRDADVPLVLTKGLRALAEARVKP